VDNVYFARPTSSFGYYRGTPYFGGDMGTEGPQVSGTNVFSAGQGPDSGTGTGWSPTILYLFALILVEMFLFAFIGRRV
jgi:hypothetical protein